MRRTILLAIAVVVFAPATAATVSPTNNFHALEDQFWAAALKDSPTFATFVGVNTYDAQLDVLSLKEMDRQTAEAADFLNQLNAISQPTLTPADQANYAILKNMLVNGIEANRFGERQMLFSSLNGQHSIYAAMGENQPFHAAIDYENYLRRIALVPDRMRSYGEISLKAAREGYVQPCVTVTRIPDTIRGEIFADPTKSRFYAPFAGEKPSSIPDAQWQSLQARAATLIRNQINPAYETFAKLYDSQLAPRCRNTVGVSALPQGKEYYAYLVRLYTTTNLTPDQIHELGLREVARIAVEMHKLARDSGYPTRLAMIREMQSNPKYFAKTPEELLAASALVTKTLDGKLPGLFTRLPRLTYGIRPMPAATAPGGPAARYQPGGADAGVAGFYMVNTSKLDQRPLWEIPVLSSHEAVPGHHMQIATQQELELPDWRRYGAYFTAFVEGWGLYAERLGGEVGMYDTPEKKMAQLSYQMWRAARLVVDTGIHAQGWSKEQAVAYMKANTALTDANIDAEVNRYISSPGQALAYKIGELKISELRARAEKALGPKFDLRRFHDAVIDQGSMPLDALDAQINAWIVMEAKQRPRRAK